MLTLLLDNPIEPLFFYTELQGMLFSGLPISLYTFSMLKNICLRVQCEADTYTAFLVLAVLINPFSVEKFAHSRYFYNGALCIHMECLRAFTVIERCLFVY